MGSGGSGSVGGGVSGGNTTTRNIIDFLGSSWGQGGMNNPVSTALISSVNDYRNAGAMSDMLLGGRGFGKSRQYRQYNPVDPQYGFVAQDIPGYNTDQPTGNENPKKPNPPPETGNGGGGGRFDPNMQPENSVGKAGKTNMAGGFEDPASMALAPGATGVDGKDRPTGAPGEPGGPPLPNKDRDPQYPVGTRGDGTPGPLGPGQWDNGDNMDDPSYYDSLIQRNGPSSNENWGINDDAPVEGQGLLGDIEGYGAWNDIDNRLKNDLGWQAGGDLMDLENQEKGLWDKFGQGNELEGQTRQGINWQSSGDLSDLEQQNKSGYLDYGKDTGLEGEMGAGYRKFGQGTDLESEVGDSWRGVAGPGQYDATRGATLEGMVKNPGFSASEKSSLKASQLLPIQSALEAQKLEGNARQAASGNAAGRWGASNAMALNAAGQASQAGRNVELDSANMMRTDRAQGLSGLGDLQGQMDARKVQGAQGLQSLSGQQRQAGLASLQGLGDLNATQRAAKLTSTQGIGDLAKGQRANQQFGINAGMQLNDQQRGAQAQAAQGIGNLGQRQRANTQWGLGALSDLNKTKTDQQAAKIGMTNDMYKTQLDQGNEALNRLTGMATTAAGGYNRSDSQSANVGASV